MDITERMVKFIVLDNEEEEEDIPEESYSKERRCNNVHGTLYMLVSYLYTVTIVLLKVKLLLLKSTPMHPNDIHDMNILAKIWGGGHADNIESNSPSIEQLNDEAVNDNSNLTTVTSKSHRYNMRTNRRLNIRFK